VGLSSPVPVATEEAVNYAALSDEVLMGLYYPPRDLRAFEEVFKRYFLLLAKSAERRLPRDLSDRVGKGEDLAQEALFRAARAANPWTTDRGPVRAWLFTILHHQVSSFLRKKRIRFNAPVVAVEEAEEQVRIECLLAEDGPSPLERLAHDELLDALAECIEELDDCLRGVVVMLMGGMSQTDVARVLEVSDATVTRWKRLAYARLLDGLYRKNVIERPETHFQEMPPPGGLR
jgi:RNA polymerase sigma factor (sigma-70 family)